MEPLLLVVVPGVLGGIIVAFLMLRFHLRAAPADAGRHLEPPSPALINMARIRVEGIGGLGLVAMAAAVAVKVPRIRLTMAIAVLLGMALGSVLIAIRKRRGPLPSSGRHPGAHSSWWTLGR